MNEQDIPKDVLAAIAMAIYDFQHQHDVESNVLTIERKHQEYLPWVDRGAMMRKLPTRNNF